MENKATDSTELHRHFEISVRGLPLCINEYATWLAEDKNTHVIQFNEKFLPLNIENEEFIAHIKFSEELVKGHKLRKQLTRKDAESMK